MPQLSAPLSVCRRAGVPSLLRMRSDLLCWTAALLMLTMWCEWCRWLGCDCPVSNFEEKFGSVTKTIALYALLPLVWAAALPFFALTTTGPPLLATTGLISTACLYFQHALIVGLPCGPASTRDAVRFSATQSNVVRHLCSPAFCTRKCTEVRATMYA